VCGGQAGRSGEPALAGATIEEHVEPAGDAVQRAGVRCGGSITNNKYGHGKKASRHGRINASMHANETQRKFLTASLSGSTAAQL
jgi:hypothetical protein